MDDIKGVPVTVVLYVDRGWASGSPRRGCVMIRSQVNGRYTIMTSLQGAR